MYFRKYPSDSGFTLIELSIVLVIIGLIIGGVLVGQDMIKGASVRAQISQVRQIETAVMTFKEKYGCLPGDCLRATNFFSGVTNGNGNGIICASVGACYTAGTNSAVRWDVEVASVFDHLAASGLVSHSQYDETVNASNDSGIGWPVMKLQGTGTQVTTGYGDTPGVFIEYTQSYLTIRAGHQLALGACGGGGGNVVGFYCGLNPEEAFRIDSKIDDGTPLSGGTRVHSMNYIYRIPGDINDELTNHCVISGQNAFNFGNTGRRCVPIIYMPF